jgi:hypothetical protein
MRFFITTFILLILGTFILNLTSDETYVGDYVLFVFIILASAAILKVVIDFVLHFRRQEDITQTFLDEPEGQTFYEIEDFARAVSKREREKASRQKRSDSD